MTDHAVVSRDEWKAAVEAVHERERELGRSSYSSDGYEERLHASRATSWFRAAVTGMIPTPNALQRTAAALSVCESRVT